MFSLSALFKKQIEQDLQQSAQMRRRSTPSNHSWLLHYPLIAKISKHVEIDRFEKQVEALQRLNGDGAPKFFGAFREVQTPGGIRPCVVMELVKGVPSPLAIKYPIEHAEHYYALCNKIFALCKKWVTHYGVFHLDAQVHNALIKPDGSIALVDLDGCRLVKKQEEAVKYTAIIDSCKSKLEKHWNTFQKSAKHPKDWRVFLENSKPLMKFINFTSRTKPWQKNKAIEHNIYYQTLRGGRKNTGAFKKCVPGLPWKGQALILGLCFNSVLYC